MSSIVIIGNGFDLQHNLKTSYNDFIRYCDNCHMNNNVLYRFFKNMNSCNGWYDFEQDLLFFFENLSRFKNNISASEHSDNYIINNKDIVSSPETRTFFDTIHEMNYPFFKKTRTQLIVESNNKTWHKTLIEIVLKDYEELKNLLKAYLLDVVDNKLIDIEIINNNAIRILNFADRIITFNYTKLLEKYSNNSIHYVHGSLTEDIILGIPYSNEMNIKEFNYIFKISQSISQNKNINLINNYSEDLNLYFIGFSFSKSDHYFFQEVKDWIRDFKNIGTKTIPPVYFNFYYHNESAKLDYLNNLRIFLGEELLVWFDLNHQIKFVKYKN